LVWVITALITCSGFWLVLVIVPRVQFAPPFFFYSLLWKIAFECPFAHPVSFSVQTKLRERTGFCGLYCVANIYLPFSLLAEMDERNNATGYN